MVCLAWTGLVLLLHFTEQRYSGRELAATDWLTTNTAAKRSPQNPRIVFLGLDDASRNLDTLFDEDFADSPALRLMKAGFPWNREVYALMIERLTAAGATAVVFDMLFPVERPGDERFRETLERHRDRVVIGANLKDNVEDADFAQSTISRKPSLILPSPTVVPSESRTDSLLGFVNVKTDEDQIVRRVIYRTSLLEYFNFPPEAQPEELLSLPARALEKCGLINLIPERRAPLRLRFCTEFLPRSLHEIFVETQWKAPPYNGGELFRGKIVLIGASGNESEDRLQTPLGTVLAPTIHLSAINAALNRDFLTETPAWGNFALIIGAGILAWALAAFVARPMLRLALLATVIIGYYMTAQVLFNETGLILILLSPLLVLTASSITWSGWEQIIDRVERQRVRRTLERYVGYDVAHEVLDNPATYLNSLGGVRKEITVLFSDVRGFTTLTENSDPQALVAQLNEYFAEMVAIIFANQGTVDKFIGDAVMAHWGSIVSAGPKADAEHAVLSALQMRKVLVRLNHGWKSRGIVELQIGIGINQGVAIVGNIGAAGAHEKMDFTVIGDAVNLGSRLEGVTKPYHIDLCIGETVADLVCDSFILRSVDLIVVKGKTRPVEVFAVLDKRTPIASDPPWLPRHEEAMTLYRAGEFTAAEKAWHEVLDQAPGDGISEVFLTRCVELQKEPPAAPWTGVYEMKSK